MIGLGLGGIESGDLPAITLEPGIVFIAQSDVEREAVAHLEVVLDEGVPVGAGAAPPGGRVGAARAGRIAQHPVGEGITGAGLLLRVFGADAGDS